MVAEVCKLGSEASDISHLFRQTLILAHQVVKIIVDVLIVELLSLLFKPLKFGCVEVYTMRRGFKKLRFVVAAEVAVSIPKCAYRVSEQSGCALRALQCRLQCLQPFGCAGNVYVDYSGSGVLCDLNLSESVFEQFGITLYLFERRLPVGERPFGCVRVKADGVDDVLVLVG